MFNEAPEDTISQSIARRSRGCEHGLLAGVAFADPRAGVLARWLSFVVRGESRLAQQ